MESTSRRVTVALLQFPKTPSFQMHGSQGPSSRRYLKTKKCPRPLPKPKITSLKKTFLKDPKKPPPEHQGAALFDLRKRLARALSHGTDIHGHLLRDFVLQPVTGFGVLKDTPTGAWIITNPKKGSIKFVHDDYDGYGRLKTMGLRPIGNVLNDHQQYADLLHDANRFVAVFREDYGTTQADTAAKGAASAVPMTKKEKRLQRELEKDKARRKAENEEKERERQLTKIPVIPGLGQRRFEAWQERKAKGTKATPPLTFKEKHTMIERTREILKGTATARQQKPGWLESLEIRVIEKDA